jgi:hypothetical protein
LWLGSSILEAPDSRSRNCPSRKSSATKCHSSNRSCPPMWADIRPCKCSDDFTSKTTPHSRWRAGLQRRIHDQITRRAYKSA